jgi:PPM family protein phosphatase
MNRPQLKFAQVGDKAAQNEVNQDASLALTMHGVSSFGITDIGFFMIADGNPLAALVAVQTAAREITRRIYLPSISSSANKPLQQALVSAFQAANTAIRREFPETSVSATSAFIVGDTLEIAQIGSPRLYLMADELELLTPHPVSPTRASNGNGSTAHQGALGSQKSVTVHTATKHLISNSRLLLCSDGLTPPMEDENMNNSIQQIVAGQPNLKRACEMIITLARTKDRNDDLSLILVKVDGATGL